ncbi:MAG: mevalonate kinase [Bacteroidia bacterium]|nr:mevalonate kinase [Bacteroidia bacterium]
MKNPLFYAKILLFGEYGIIEDSMGLSIPYNQFKGTLKSDAGKNDFALTSNKNLESFYNYLKNLQEKGESLFELDIERLGKDIKGGLYFDSSIPQGFGIGSSGALVASVYDKYAVQKINVEDEEQKDRIVSLKAILSQMESFFHGKSSGLDTLICYLNLPILIKSKTDLGTVGLPSENDEGKGAIFLLNSGQQGQTQNMVTIFLEKCKNEGFRNLVRTQFKSYNDACISAFLNKEKKSLFSSLKNLSRLVFDNFSPMIPDKYRGLWQEGIESNAYYLKLCGSGGGGFILGFTQDIEEARKKLKGHHLEVIHRF